MQVQNTNDNSIVSKLSSSNMGYFDDECLKMFVDKQQRRSPIINRGYYIRFKAIESVFKAWLQSGYQTFQIISLGAGFDSSYFRMKKKKLFPESFKYIEVDFPEVMKRKLEYIHQSEFKESISKSNFQCKNLIASGNDYFMLGCDLKDTNHSKIQKCFNAIGVCPSIPTLFLSECAITYMDTESSSHLIKWIQKSFPHSSIVTYEQVYPSDGFGIVMQNHFSVLGCPLKSVGTFPDIDAQKQRFIEMGWADCEAIGMLDFFLNLDEEEKLRISKLELFDEFEMWHEKCKHYVLVWACQGDIPVPAFIRKAATNRVIHRPQKPVVKWKQHHSSVQRFGHAIANLSSDTLCVFGGFGLSSQKRHQRMPGMNHVHLTETEEFEEECPISEASKKILGERMYHSMILLSDRRVAVIGGRTSPASPYDKVVVLNHLSPVVEEKTTMPLATWRHSAALVISKGLEHIVIFGGCTAGGNVTNDCYFLDVSNWTWHKMPDQDETPSARHSHSSVSISDSQVLVTGGLSPTEDIFDTVYRLDCEERVWSKMGVTGLLPRYSHTSHAVGDRVFLVGGVTNVCGYTLGVAIIDLSSWIATEYSAPAQDPEYPVLLTNHCSYYCETGRKITVIGGGGNCFSFGTHFNDSIVELNIEDLV